MKLVEAERFGWEGGGGVGFGGLIIYLFIYFFYTLRGKTNGVPTIGHKVPYTGRPPNGQWT